MPDPQELIVLKNFTDILDRLNIPYAIGGSIASSIYGIVRFTQDADITVEPFDSQADKFLEILTGQYYVGKEAVYQALRQRSSFNVIHLESAFKIDIFVRRDTSFDGQLIPRRKSLRLSDSLEKSFSVVSPEDVILLKLRWFCDGGSVSDRQWNDVVEVLRIQNENLDFEYLKKWAAFLRISSLLEKALAESRDYGDKNND